MKKKQVLQRQCTVLVTQHWSQAIVDEFGACRVPQVVRDSATPEEAWEKLDAEQLVWAIGDASGRSLEKVEDTYDADSIRKVYPKPPRELLSGISKWVKKPMDMDDVHNIVHYHMDGNHAEILKAKRNGS